MTAFRDVYLEGIATMPAPTASAAVVFAVRTLPGIEARTR